LRGGRQAVDGHDPGARRDVERHGIGGRDRRLQVPSVDDLATYRDIVKLPGLEASDLLTVGPAPHVLVAGKDANPGLLSRSAASAKCTRTSSPVARS